MSDSPMSVHQFLDQHPRFSKGLAALLLAIMAVMLWYSAHGGAVAPLPVKYAVVFVTFGDFALLLVLYYRQIHKTVRRAAERWKIFCEKNESRSKWLLLIMGTVSAVLMACGWYFNSQWTSALGICAAAIVLTLATDAPWFQKL